MSAADPCVTLWAALESAGCAPRGRPYDYYARCPAHHGDGHSLHVNIGGDGRAVVHCFAHQCDAETITAALSLPVSSLFPAGHHRARRRHLREARRSDFTGPARTLANVIAALDAIGAEWTGELRMDCPRCGSAAAFLSVSTHGVWFRCPGDATAEALGYSACTLDQFTNALAGSVEDLERREAA